MPNSISTAGRIKCCFAPLKRILYIPTLPVSILVYSYAKPNLSVATTTFTDYSGKIPVEYGFMLVDRIDIIHGMATDEIRMHLHFRKIITASFGD